MFWWLNFLLCVLIQLSQSLDEQKLHSSASKQSKVSLKDLCVEDKRRIANLIKELARYVLCLYILSLLSLFLYLFFLIQS